MGFRRFYETWFEQLHHLMNQLPKPPATQEDDRRLLHEVVSHFAEYYRVKSLATRRDAVSLFAAPWCSTLERSLHWIGGWRPTTAFHLIYTESSMNIEYLIADVVTGVRFSALVDISPVQFNRVSDLQCQTVHEENSITEQLSDWQEGATDLLGMYADVDAKIERLVSVVEKADDLRLRTIRRVVELLTPRQALELLDAAAQLQFGIQGWGLDHDRQRMNI